MNCPHAKVATDTPGQSLKQTFDDSIISGRHDNHSVAVLDTACVYSSHHAEATAHAFEHVCHC